MRCGKEGNRFTNRQVMLWRVGTGSCRGILWDGPQSSPTGRGMKTSINYLILSITSWGAASQLTAQDKRSVETRKIPKPKCHRCSQGEAIGEQRGMGVGI